MLMHSPKKVPPTNTLKEHRRAQPNNPNSFIDWNFINDKHFQYGTNPIQCRTKMGNGKS